MSPRTCIVALPALALLACHPKPATTDSTSTTCPRDGVVPPDMRDVERDAEGTAYAMFGPAPDHVADYTRAAGVYSLLQTVWGNATTECPDMPTDSVAVVNDAMTRLGTAIPAQDQKGGAYAGNDIHMQTGTLFAWFNRPKPVELEEMDATFLRVGLDAWYGDWTSYNTNLSAINTEWAVVEPTIATLTPTCHRVAGTDSVQGDINQTLSTLQTAGTAQDVASVQIGSDDGLNEVDILEQLYDCPADGTVATTGLGSACSTTSDCNDPTLVCDTANAGGRCAPDPATTNVGAQCATTVDCGNYERDACNNEIGDGYPGGYCTMEPCNDIQVCSPGATCVAMPFETPACMASCTTDTDCRASEGYVCQLFPTTPPAGYGPSDHACAFACASDDQCTSPLTCDVASGKCKP